MVACFGLPFGYRSWQVAVHSFILGGCDRRFTDYGIFSVARGRLTGLAVMSDRTTVLAEPRRGTKV